jgi:methyl-accepting chemotaxis protein
MEEDTQKNRKRTKLFQTIVIRANTLLSRWSASSNASANVLNEVESTLSEVIRETENAAMHIGASFQSIMQKTRRQTMLATGLIKKPADGDEDSKGGLGLQDYVGLYEKRLAEVNAQLSHLSKLADDMIGHQRKVKAETALLDTVIDEMHAMASSISRISLNASVAAVKQEIDSAAFVDVADRVRAIAEQSHALEHRARRGLESIRHEVAEAVKSTTTAGDYAKSTSEASAQEAGRLSGEILAKGSEIETTLGTINDLGREINREIEAIIIAMQFQDITQQKLERARGANLESVRESLDSLSHETLALMQRDLYRAILAYSQSSIHPHDIPAGNVPPPPAPAPAASAPEKPRANAELF